MAGKLCAGVLDEVERFIGQNMKTKLTLIL
jgi:hypothetical protein